ncbi:MAG TPA: MarR family transcriptional regulator [Gemmatimonadales bacterium]|jgi:DNA-binding MarR family transcriptional regulator|nr:MarR family transcriptional regulator [Gemmatimonadales bacterium]
MPQRRRQSADTSASSASSAPPEFAAANTLHSAAIRLLRAIRVEDRASGLSGPRLSALSVIVFGGPLPMAALAAAEQVQPPTITRLVRELERDGLVERVRDADDRRVLRVRATARGRQVMEEGRRRRVARLAAGLKALPPADRKLLARAAELIERLARPEPPAPPGTPP